MCTNEIKDTFNRIHFLTKLQVESLQLYHKCNLLQVFISQDASTFQEHLFPGTFFTSTLERLQAFQNIYYHKSYIFGASPEDQAQRKPKTLHVSNGSLNVLKWQKIRFNYDIMAFETYNKLQDIAKPFQEVYFLFNKP